MVLHLSLLLLGCRFILTGILAKKSGTSPRRQSNGCKCNHYFIRNILNFHLYSERNNNNHVTETRLSLDDFTIGSPTSHSVCISWSSQALKAKGVKGFDFIISSTKTPERPFTLSAELLSGSLTLKELRAFTRYQVNVRENGFDKTILDLGQFNTWPTGTSY